MDRRALTNLQRKAWSKNIGHESIQTTDIHYGHVNDDDRFKFLDELLHIENTDCSWPITAHEKKQLFEAMRTIKELLGRLA